MRPSSRERLLESHEQPQGNRQHPRLALQAPPRAQGVGEGSVVVESSCHHDRFIGEGHPALVFAVEAEGYGETGQKPRPQYGIFGGVALQRLLEKRLLAGVQQAHLEAPAKGAETESGPTKGVGVIVGPREDDRFGKRRISVVMASGAGGGRPEFDEQFGPKAWPPIGRRRRQCPLEPRRGLRVHQCCRCAPTGEAAPLSGLLGVAGRNVVFGDLGGGARAGETGQHGRRPAVKAAPRRAVQLGQGRVPNECVCEDEATITDRRDDAARGGVIEEIEHGESLGFGDGREDRGVELSSEHCRAPYQAVGRVRQSCQTAGEYGPHTLGEDAPPRRRIGGTTRGTQKPGDLPDEEWIAAGVSRNG